MKFLVTGAAGFIGFHTAHRLINEGHDVLGVDNLNAYYSPRLKQARLAELDAAAATASGDWSFLRGDLADKAFVETLFSDNRFDRVIHLAAQAGVRHSLDHPDEYVQSNIVAFVHLLEACRHAGMPHLVYASTSSVYGANTKVPFSETDAVDHPLQLYAATKRANELMAHSYSHLFGLPTTGLRFFTVYGPWGRPDMAPWLFADAILNGRPITLFNNGIHSRDFTYVGDIVDGILRSAEAIPEAGGAYSAPDRSSAPFQVFNIGNSRPATLMDFVTALESALGKTADKKFAPLQPGDVVDTFADVSRLSDATGYAPKVDLEEGVQRFIDWFVEYNALTDS